MRCAVVLFALFCAPAVQAEWGQFDYDFDADKKPWLEIQAQLPSYPKAEALVEFTVSPATRNRYFIDPASVSVGEDKVVRYAVLIESPAGGRTVNFEGMRCDTGERKLYAFGRKDGEWSRNRHARWEVIPVRQQTSYHRELFYAYFCAGGEGQPVLGKIQYRLRSGGYRAPD